MGAQVVASGAIAQGAPATLADLLKAVQNSRAEEQKLNAEREREYRAARDRQAGLMAEAVRKRAAAEAESSALSARYDANELRINELNELLRQRQGNLGELFGVTRQIAGEISNSLGDSLINSEFPAAAGEEDRVSFLKRLADAKSLPSIPELERMWFEIHREATESGAVVKYNAKVVLPDATSEEREIVRVGGFTATSGDEYLVYRDGVLKVLPRQLPGRARGLAEDLAEASGNEYQEMVVDPARGVLTELVTERPSWVDRFIESEPIVYFILFVGFVGLVLSALQTVYLLGENAKVRRQLGSVSSPSNDNALGRVLAAFRGDPNRIEEDAEVAELRISEAVLREVPRLERFQSFLRLAVAAGPLLGLVGTVIGMIITFQTITESGQSDPRLMANGIGQAMIATVAGLGIAIPLLFINAFLSSMSKGIVQVLDEQSTGLLAESIEKRRG
ncbi:MAG: MotA/TolQ/ExbB proton channel family protein [Myxococcota bacterium]